jgi:hypothetical protein
MNQITMPSCLSESFKHEMAKAKLQILIDSDLKKTIAKLAIDKDTSVTSLVEQALIKEYGNISDLAKPKNHE